MKSFSTFITEGPNPRPQIRQAMNDNGYRLLGAGLDVMIFKRPDESTLIKVVAPEDYDTGSIAALIRANEAWWKYCLKHANNPHLMKFSRARLPPIVVDGQEFPQYRIENLEELSEAEHNLCLEMYRAITDYGYTFDEYVGRYYDDQINDRIQRKAHPRVIRALENNRERARTLQSLFVTMQRVRDMGLSLGFEFTITIRPEQISMMKRKDDTLVITGSWDS